MTEQGENVTTSIKTLKLEEIHVETLLFLHECSPIWCGDFPSKKARDELEEAGYAKTFPLKGEHGHWVMTDEGLEALREKFDNSEETLKAKLAAFNKDRLERKRATRHFDAGMPDILSLSEVLPPNITLDTKYQVKGFGMPPKNGDFRVQRGGGSIMYETVEDLNNY